MSIIAIEPHNTKFSIRNAYALALCSQLAYEKPNIIQQKMVEQGFRSEFISSGPKDTDTQLFIAHSGTAIVIAFRGTANIIDWMNDAKVGFVDEPHGKVHRGFNAALDSVWKEIIETLQHTQIYAQSLWVTGHSLGGALATLAAARLSLDMHKPINGIYTFGQPRVGDRQFSREVDSELKHRFFRFVNNNDIVTRIPTRLGTYNHAGSVCFFDAAGTLHDDVSYWYAFLESIKGDFEDKLDLLPAFAENHFIARYIENIKKNFIQQ
ncbi:MAG: lipase family protein [Methylococcales bacterium]|nr:lipase family protein [Methylococcales bacterium]